MSSALSDLYRHEFQDENVVVVNHQLGRDYIGGIRLFVGEESRNDLVETIVVSPEDPKNKLTVKLKEVCSGVIQLVGTNYLRLGQASTKEASTGMVFGGDNKHIISSVSSQTTSESKWIEKASSTRELTAGTYRIGVAYIWSASASGKGRRFNGRLMLGDEQLMLHAERAAQAEDEVPAYFFVYRTLEAGEYTISLQFKKEGSNLSVSMKNASIEIWKTSDG